ncbi:cytochrome P450 705A12 [Brassica napus]|uniref:cytochrome P450 705A12 n=1 Tax=Brassica napus TaxID=3708 RepID=UPI002078C412|nr:cytochrome P450 705A12 [Brassica napus]
MVDEFQNCFIFILLCFFTVFCYSVLFCRKTKLEVDFPPSPPSLPVIGHLHLLLSAVSHKAFQNISSKYGPLLYLRLFSFPIVLASSASVAYELFRTHDVNVSSRMPPITIESLIFGSSGFASAPFGDYAKFMKKLLATRFFRTQAIENLRGVRAEELERFYLNLYDKAAKKESVEIGEETMKFTNNMICRMCMGRSCSVENGGIERVRELIIKCFAMSKKLFLANTCLTWLEKLGISPFKKEIMDVSHGFDELLERILVEHEERPEQDQDMDMMDLLLEASREENAEYKITRKQIKSLFVEIFMAGIDTAAQATQWTMAEIINNPKILERLRGEIDLVVGKARLIQETDIPNLPYLQAVVKEGLRLHPPGPFLVRRFQESCKIKEFYVPGQTTLLVNVYAIMRDPDLWEDPDEFKPERFLSSRSSEQEEEIKGQAFKYIPFGAGRRGCPAGNLGPIFVGIAVGMMVQCFDWRINGHGEISMEEVIAGISLTMAHPLKCTPVSRLSSFSL